MAERPVQPGNLKGAANDGPSRRRAALVVAIALSVLLHAIGLWWLMARVPPIPVVTASGDESRISVVLAPLAANPPPAAPRASVPAEEKPAPQPPRHRKVRKPLVAIERIPVIPAPSAAVLPPLAASPPAAVPDDMSSMLEAARKRRAEARVLDAGSEPAEDENQRANRIVRANVAAAQIGARGVDRDQNGGVFQIRRVGLRNAEFMFRGWNTNFGRNSSQLVTVDQGDERDIQIAVVKKMIELIRSKKTDEFIWDSHRLGKELTLSAKPEHGAELQQFLLREFFPDYVPVARLN